MANVELHELSPSTGVVKKKTFNIDEAEYSNISAALPSSVSGAAQVVWRESPLGFRSIRTLESASNILALSQLTKAQSAQGQATIVEATLELLVGNDLNLAVSANGHTIASTTVLASYYNNVSTATVTTADAIRLPDIANNLVVVVKNSSTTPILIFPFANTGTIVGTGLATAAAYTLAVGAKVSFYTAKDATDSTSANYRNYYLLT